jgi:hypothetical protein
MLVMIGPFWLAGGWQRKLVPRQVMAEREVAQPQAAFPRVWKRCLRSRWLRALGGMVVEQIAFLTRLQGLHRLLLLRAFELRFVAAG